MQSLVILRVVRVEASIVIVQQLLTIVDDPFSLHQYDWAVLRHFHHSLYIGLVSFSVIHEVASRGVIFWVNYEVRHCIGALDELKSICIDLFLAVLRYLAQTHHIACVSGDQFTLLDRSASYESKSFSSANHSDCYWESLVALCV